MKRKIRSIPRKAALAALLALPLGVAPDIVGACTRFIYGGPDNRILTARSMDWADEIGTNLWIFPRGVERTGLAGPNSITWTSQYGSVTASAFDIATSDGMNEAGLVANLLWLAEAEYPRWDGEAPTLSVSLWAQYMLDNFATVAEAVEAAEREGLVVVTDTIPGTERTATVHLSLSDSSGDSAILEYIGGELTIHHGREHRVMTNSPIYEQQLALTAYWRSIGGTTMLPGTNRAADRFARASFYIDAIPKVDDRRIATAATFSVIRNVSVPYGITTPGEPNISSTRWRVVADHKDMIYHFESALTPNVFWVDLTNFDFSPEAGTRTLQLGVGQSRVFSGEVSDRFEVAEPFDFLAVAPEEH